MFRSLQQNIQICSNRQLFCMPFQNLVSKNTFSLSLHILTFFVFFFYCNIKFINVSNILLFFWTRRWVSRNQICTKNTIPSLPLESTEFYYCTISLDTLCSLCIRANTQLNVLMYNEHTMKFCMRNEN